MIEMNEGTPIRRRNGMEAEYQIKHVDEGDVFLCEFAFNSDSDDARNFIVAHLHSDYVMFVHTALDGDINQLCCINLDDTSKNTQRVRKTIYNQFKLL